MKPEFPRSRKGYEPESVDSYIEQLELSIQQLQQELGAKASAADTASSKVHEIVAAAENTAERLTGEAQEDARLTKMKAGQDADNTREEAERQADQRIGKVQNAADDLQRGAEDLGASLESQMDGVRANLNRLIEDVESVRLTINEEADRVLGEGRLTGARGQIDASRVAHSDSDEIESGPTNEDDAVRSVVENLARNGSTREEATRYLNDTFEIEDPTEIIEDVYSAQE